MALADSSLILQMQLALIGIVLVTGLFYLWRSLCRIEDKVSRVALKVSQCCGTGGGGGSCPIPPFKQFKQEEVDFRMKPMNLADADAHAQQLMKEVFGEEPEVVVAAVITETVPEEVPAPKIPETNVIVEEEPEPSEAETENTNPLSKNKLNKMTPDELKNLCVQRGLSGEGNKKTLVDRLLGITRD